MHPLASVVPPSPPGHLEAFVQAFPLMRRLHEACLTPGMLVVAVHDSGVITSHAHLVDDGEHAVIGRHARCRLQLTRDPAVATRHAMVVLARRGGGVALDAWAIGPTGMRTEDGLVWGTLTTRAPSAFVIGTTRIFAFPTGPGVPAWTSDPATTWAMLPPQRAPIGTPFPVRPGASFDGDDPTATVDAARANLRVRAWRIGGEVQGVLRLVEGEVKAAVPLTDVALERGVHLGRADRCDAGGRFSRLSRLHAVVLRRDGAVWVYDAASHYGLALDQAPVARVCLDGGAAVSLGGTLRIAWEPRAR